MTKLMKLISGFALAVVLTACGGGGGSSGSVPGTTPDPTASATMKVADFSVFITPNTLPNSGTATANVSITAVDSARNIVAGASVTVSIDQGVIFTPGATPAVTGSAGVFAGVISLASDKTNRDVNITVTINGITRKSTVKVTGSKLTIQAAPSNPAPGQNVVLSLALADAAGNAIPNGTVTMGGTVPSIAGRVLTTNSEGKITATFAAPASAGIYVVNGVGSGVSSGDYQLQVFSTVIPPANIPAGVVPALAASPNVVPVNSPGTSSNRSTVRFLMLDSLNRPISNVRVKLMDVTTGLPTVGSSIVGSGQTLYTDASGSVSVEYIAGQNPSPTNGVQIMACYSANDFLSATDCPQFVQTTLTVAGQALAVSIGDDNLLQKGSGTYIKQFVVTVADSAGRPVVNAPVDISVDLTHYGKYNQSPGFVPAAFTSRFVPASLTASSSFGATTATTATTAVFTWCPNEDLNRNGFVDQNENVNGSVDSNGQATLEPRRSDLLISYATPNVTSTDSSGILLIKVEYSQRFATWLSYRVRLIANVQGSQGIAERLFVTDFVEGDQDNGSFLQAPYGINPSCTSAQ